MRPSRLFLSRILAAAALPFLVLAAVYAVSPTEKAGPSCPGGDWGYAENNGPAKWVGLSPCNCQCGNGGEQSPIDIVNPQRAALPPIVPSYGVVELEVKHTGHEIKARVLSGLPAQRSIRIGTVSFELSEFHFHTPREHLVAGQDPPHTIEMHMVHSTPGGRIAVLGIFINQGGANPQLTKIWDRLPVRPGDKITVTNFDLAALLPRNLASYRYAGSLTTPTCGQGVQWNVLANPITITPDQVKKLQDLFYRNAQFPNGNRRRPLQALNGRTVFTDVP